MDLGNPWMEIWDNQFRDLRFRNESREWKRKGKRGFRNGTQEDSRLNFYLAPISNRYHAPGACFVVNDKESHNTFNVKSSNSKHAFLTKHIFFLTLKKHILTNGPEFLTFDSHENFI